MKIKVFTPLLHESQWARLKVELMRTVSRHLPGERLNLVQNGYDPPCLSILASGGSSAAHRPVVVLEYFGPALPGERQEALSIELEAACLRALRLTRAEVAALRVTFHFHADEPPRPAPVSWTRRSRARAAY